MKNSNNGHVAAVGLSNRQYNLLRDAQEKGGITLNVMLAISQTTAGSIVRRGYFQWNQALQAFSLTPFGLGVLEQFAHTDISRKNIAAPLSKYINIGKKSKGKTA